MAPRIVRRSRRKQRIVSISLAPDDAAWLDTLVELLEQGGYPRAGRSEIVRVALLDLRNALGTRQGQDIVRYFVEREAERLVSALVRRIESSGGLDDPEGRS